MILSGVGSVEMSNEGQTTTADSVWQKWLPSAGAYLIIGDKFRPMCVQDIRLRHQLSNASIVLDKMGYLSIAASESAAD